MKKYGVRIIAILTVLILSAPLGNVFAAGSAKNLMLVSGGENSAQENTGVGFEKDVLPTVQDYLLSAYLFIAIGMLLFMGFKLISARGSEEEFKHAWIALVYVVIGLTIPPLSYVAVKIVTGLHF